MRVEIPATLLPPYQYSDPMSISAVPRRMIVLPVGSCSLLPLTVSQGRALPAPVPALPPDPDEPPVWAPPAPPDPTPAPPPLPLPAVPPVARPPVPSVP